VENYLILTESLPCAHIYNMTKRISKPLNLTLPPKIKAALTSYLEATEEKPSAFIARLLRQRLTEEGFMVAEEPETKQGKEQRAGQTAPPARTPIKYSGRSTRQIKAP